MCRHRSVSLNNEKICCEISEDKIAVGEKTAGLRRGKFSNLNSACLNVLVPVKIFQFQDMLNQKVNDIGTQQTAYIPNWQIQNSRSLACLGLTGCLENSST